MPTGPPKATRGFRANLLFLPNGTENYSNKICWPYILLCNCYFLFLQKQSLLALLFFLCNIDDNIAVYANSTKIH